LLGTRFNIQKIFIYPEIRFSAQTLGMAFCGSAICLQILRPPMLTIETSRLRGFF